MIHYDAQELEKDWRDRSLDLFPYMEGFFSLLRTREGNLERTRKKLQKANPSTLVQFLSSEDREVSGIAGTLIQSHPNQDLINAILIYSLDKVHKPHYASTVGKCLAGCPPPHIGLMCLFYYFHQSSEQRELYSKLFQSYWKAGTEGVNGEEAQGFIKNLFQVIKGYLFENISNLKAMSSISEFLILKNTLIIPLKIGYYLEPRKEIRLFFDYESEKMGQAISSFQPLLSGKVFPNLHEAIFLILPWIGLLRLKKDLAFLEEISLTLGQLKLNPIDHKRLSVLLEKVISSLTNDKQSIYELLPADLFF